MSMFRKVLHFLPRVLTVAVVAFFYLFTLEAFSPEFGWREGLVHFVTATVILSISILAWKKPKIGGWLFLIPLAVSLISGNLNKVFGALAIIGVLYLSDGFLEKAKR